MNIRIGCSVPVLADCGVAVFGMTLPGMKAALDCARGGQRTVLIDPGCFPGTEWFGWHRLWQTGLPEAWTEWLPKDAQRTPAAIKRHLEDLLEGAGVVMLYAMTPFHVRETEGSYTVLCGGKQGIFAVRADRIIDALARGALADRRPWSDGALCCCADVLSGAPLSAGDERDVRIHRGPYGENHFIVEVRQSAAGYGQDLFADSRAESRCRRETLCTVAVLAQRYGWGEFTLGMGSLWPMPFSKWDPVKALRAGAEGAALCLGGAGCTVLEPGRAYEAGIHAGGGQDGGTAEVVFRESSLRVAQREHIGGGLLFSAPAVQTDVLVAGLGTSGALCAHMAAQYGVKVLGAEPMPIAGGTGTAGGVWSYWYRRPGSLTERVDAAVAKWQKRLFQKEKFLRWSEHDSWNGHIKAAALEEMLDDSGVVTAGGALCCGAVMEGSRITGSLLASSYGPVLVGAAVTADATGDGDVAVAAGAEYVYGSASDGMAMYASVAQYTAPGRYQNNFTTCVQVGDPFDYNRFLWTGHRRGSDVYDYGVMLAPRETRHVKGDHTHTLAEQITAARFEDTIALCFSNHDPKGPVEDEILKLGLQPPNLLMEVSYRALLPAGVEGMLVIGKAFSATHDAIAALRMQADLQHIGGAAGIACALSVKAGKTPRGLGGHAVRDELLKLGVLNPRNGEPVMTSEQAVRELRPDESWEWIEMPMEAHLDPTPFMLLMGTEETGVLPLLEKKWKKSPGLLLAQLLAKHGSPLGADLLYETIMAYLQTEGLPQRQASCRFTAVPPNHGSMPEMTYLFHALIRIRDRRLLTLCGELVRRITAAGRNWADPKAGLWYHIESVAAAAECERSPEYIPVLRSLLELPELYSPVAREKSEAIDFIKERQDMAALRIIRALCMCGDSGARDRLSEFCGDVRGVFSEYAQKTLREN